MASGCLFAFPGEPACACGAAVVRVARLVLGQTADIPEPHGALRTGLLRGHAISIGLKWRAGAAGSTGDCRPILRTIHSRRQGNP